MLTEYLALERILQPPLELDKFTFFVRCQLAQEALDVVGVQLGCHFCQALQACLTVSLVDIIQGVQLWAGQT